MSFKDVVGVVHAKSTSSRIENKNSLVFFSKPLFLIALEKLKESGIQVVYLDTDSKFFSEVAIENGFRVSKRAEAEANNNVDGNQLIQNFVSRENINPEYLVQLSCTLPFISIDTLKNVIQFSLQHEVSGFLGSEDKEYKWKVFEDLTIKPNYDLSKIPNSFELQSEFKEVTGLYVLKMNQVLNKIQRIPSISFMHITSGLEVFDLNYSIDLKMARIIELGLTAQKLTEIPSGLTGQQFIYKEISRN